MEVINHNRSNSVETTFKFNKNQYHQYKKFNQTRNSNTESMTLTKQIILKSLCDKTLEPIQKVIDKNFSENKIVNESTTLSIFSFVHYTKLKMVDMSIYNVSTNNKEYCDIILEYNYKNQIFYIRWFEEMINHKLPPLVRNLSELTQDKKQKQIIGLIDRYLTKFFSAQIFNNLDELYNYVKINCINRNNNKILTKIKKKITINDLIIRKQDSNIFEILELSNKYILLPEEIKFLDNYLIDNLPTKRKKIEYKKGIYTYQYFWYEHGSILTMIDEYIANMENTR